MFRVDELQHACINSSPSLIILSYAFFICLRKFEFLMRTKCELLSVMLLMMLQVYGESKGCKSNKSHIYMKKIKEIVFYWMVKETKRCSKYMRYSLKL